MADYNPFAEGLFPVKEQTLELHDAARDRTFPTDVWKPSATGDRPLVLFSHSSGAGRRQSAFLCEHLASHGYTVAALDHSEMVAPELARRPDETPEQNAARRRAWIENRVPDMRFLLDALITSELSIDPAYTALVGHSFGGWTVLATPDADERIVAVVALAPAGSTIRKPGMLDVELAFAWKREVPTLLLVAEEDVSLPLEGMHELFARAPEPKRMFVLRGADHLHFMHDAEQLHEAIRGMEFPGDLSWLPGAMRPFAELCPAADAHAFTRGLTLAHLDAVIMDDAGARRWLANDAVHALAERGVAAWTP